MLDPIKLPLVKKLYKAHYPSAKAKADEVIWVAQHQSAIAALLRLRRVESAQLLTGMLVPPEYRGQGVGAALLDHCAQHHFDSQVFCFAYAHLEAYYAAHHFQRIDPETLPNGLKMAYQRYTVSGKDLIPMQFNLPITCP
ncbi:GNAT family N-acetyltransferase [Vibrio sp. SM6]|uniref:GNAT family N-acetyltransferase n=1 Tax=Vibrio agarilyticus TaxID=2726741 RepID=A0A7X8TT99_9VIBR|nr:GNAT family N-acetyltransferase [Vibrio agarilyticus]NLS14480.1 GNAT family N-acetyltransferase [Vibrio agarilyticus]